MWLSQEELRNTLQGKEDLSTSAEKMLTRVLRDLECGNTELTTARSRGLWDKTKNWHFHLFPEFFLQLSGGCRFEFPHQKIELLPGRLLQVPTGLPHKESAYRYGGGGFSNFVLMPKAEDVMEVHFAYTQGNSIHPDCACSRQLELPKGFSNLVEQLAALPAAPISEWERITRRHLLSAMLAQTAEALSKPELRQMPEDTLHPKVKLAIHRINALFPGTTPTIRQVSAFVGCTPNYLSSIFRAETGMKFTDYLNEIRLEFARKMLRTTSHKVAEIAWSCGFLDPGHFAGLYRERFGVTPHKERLNAIPPQ